MPELSPREKIEKITANLQEVLNPEIIEDVVLKQNRPLIVYWGTATTGRPHCGYFVPIMKIGELLNAGCTVKILLADIHAQLDADKCPEELVGYRADYYQFCVQALLNAVNVPLDKLEFVKGSSYQTTPNFNLDMLRLYSKVGENDAKRAGSDVVKQEKDPKLSGMVYPIMQCLDEEYLKVDAQFGGVDQRKIFVLAGDILPRIGYKKRAHLMNAMVPGLQGGKMSASDKSSKIDILDNAEEVTKKLRKAEAVPKIVKDNGLLAFVQHVLLPASSSRQGTPSFKVERRDEGALEYSDIEKIHTDYENDVLTPQLLKPAIAKALNELLETVQEEFKASSKWQEVEKKAYPPPVEVKKEKKVKNKGSKHPGGAKPEGEKAEQEIVVDMDKLKVNA